MLLKFNIHLQKYIISTIVSRIKKNDMGDGILYFNTHAHPFSCPVAI